MYQAVNNRSRRLLSIHLVIEMGEEGIIVARTDSEGADLTQKIPVVKEPGDIASHTSVS